MRSKLAVVAALALAFATLAAAPPPVTLTLDDALLRAEKHLPDFAASSERRVKAETLWKRAAAAFQPKLTLSASMTFAPPIPSPFGGEPLRSLTGESGSTSITMSLFDGRAFPAASAARRIRDAELLSADRDDVDARIAVARAYYAALAAGELEKVARRALDAAKAHLDIAEARFAGGGAVRTDVTRARIEVVHALTDITRLEGQSRAARELVAFMCGIEGDLTLVRPGPPPLPFDPATAGVEEAEARARAARPDLKAVALSADAKHELETAAWWALAPTLAVTATGSVSSDPSFIRPSPDYSLVFTVAWTLYDGGTRYADMDDRAAERRTADAKAAVAGEKVGLEVRTALRDLETARAVSASVADEVALARETLALAEERFKGGLGTGLEVIDATQALREAEATQVSEDLNVQLLALELLRAIGDDLRRLSAP
ncbi:MAG TPA: TolC family protein [Myxococcota bacterium]|jgi:outer membrane protein TolC|nr:TolC family protein [Myxococcota bacterium]